MYTVTSTAGLITRAALIMVAVSSVTHANLPNGQEEQVAALRGAILLTSLA